MYCVNGLIRFYDELIGFCKGLRWWLDFPMKMGGKKSMRKKKRLF